MFFIVTNLSPKISVRDLDVQKKRELWPCLHLDQTVGKIIRYDMNIYECFIELRVLENLSGKLSGQLFGCLLHLLAWLSTSGVSVWLVWSLAEMMKDTAGRVYRTSSHRQDDIQAWLFTNS